MLFVSMIAAWCALSAGLSLASPIVESADRLEMNWSTMKVRFFGQSHLRTMDGDDGYKSAEKRAWQDGLTHAAGVIQEYYIRMHRSHFHDAAKLEEEAKESAHGIVTSTSSVKTVYGGSGEVRVYLENSLPRAFAPRGIRFRQKEANQGLMSAHTGLIFQLDRPIKPRATYTVVDDQGEVLFGPHDMAEEAFRKTLMGRWYRRPTASELHEAVGKNPIILPVEVTTEGQLRVPRASWAQALEGHKSMLVNGVIALVQP